MSYLLNISGICALRSTYIAQDLSISHCTLWTGLLVYGIVNPLGFCPPPLRTGYQILYVKPSYDKNHIYSLPSCSMQIDSHWLKSDSDSAGAGELRSWCCHASITGMALLQTYTLSIKPNSVLMMQLVYISAQAFFISMNLWSRLFEDHELVHAWVWVLLE